MSTDREVQEAAEVDFFDRYYAEQVYHLTGWQLRLERELALLLASAGERRLESVLGVACGDGLFECLLAPHVQKITAFDISPEAVRIADQNARRAGIDNVAFEYRSFFDLDPGDSFDAVVCLAGLHHMPPEETVRFIEHAHTALSPGGMLYAQDPNRRGILRWLGRKILGKRYDTFHSPDERELDPRETAAQMRRSGFERVKIIPIDFTLIPGLFFFKNGPAALMHLFRLIDWVACRSPLRSLASGTTVVGYRPG